jgi:hypothetical protein
MFAPAVVSASATAWADVYVPGAGEKVGVAAVGVTGGAVALPPPPPQPASRLAAAATTRYL